MTNEQMVEVAKDLTEALAPFVISGAGAKLQLGSESINVIYHSLVGFTSRNDQPSVDVKLPSAVIQSLKEVS
ncbi:hypothetical protein B9T25_13140 [Acinetobacter sp. ANC 4470]|uniref:hypothetical protein n=1 Tax=Acinetobacter sp. ANC 4470 TaxID=1977881 RepID=UPI000A33A1D1|nr:hypothetical protein [Acinetobacter sp. ANC 4470]OTG64380.1 hypothetical protein B9T25_13140 [Acinetobacter sp. ANC 4470]